MATTVLSPVTALPATPMGGLCALRASPPLTSPQRTFPTRSPAAKPETTAHPDQTDNPKPTMTAHLPQSSAPSSSNSSHSSNSSTSSKRSGAAMSANLKVNTQKANSRPRLGRLPSLKQISERLATNANNASSIATTSSTAAGTTETTSTATTTTATTTTSDMTAPSSTPSTTKPAPTSTAMPSSSVASPLADVTTTTNLPLPAMQPSRSVSPSGRRLKLPASAMTRANLNSSFAKVDPEPKPNVKESEQVKQDTKPPAATEASPVTKEPEEVETTRAAEPLRARASLGRGLPPVGDGAGDNIVVPDVVVRKSSPGPEERYTNADGEHPLGHKWTLHYDSKTYKPDAATVKTDKHLSSWEANLLKVGTFDTVQGFARHMNNVRLPSTLAKGANYHLFKDGIRPMWEDPANHKGGKWVMFCRGLPLFDVCWANLVMALVGETLDNDDKVCGIVASARPKLDRIQVWTRVADDVEALNALAQRILDTLGLDPRESDNISLEFQPHSASAKIPPGLTKLTLSAPVSRSISLANLAQNNDNRLRRSPSSPGGSFGAPASTQTSTHGPSPLAAGSAPMRRTGSAGASAFSGPLGAPRRLASTVAGDAH